MQAAIGIEKWIKSLFEKIRISVFFKSRHFFLTAAIRLITMSDI